MSARGHETKARFTPADRLTVCLGVLALIAGIVLLAVAPGFVASIVGACLLGISAVAFVALAFLLVGESEDRDYKEGGANDI